jgi:hypothetical protein
MVQIARWGAMIGVHDASAVIFGRDFDPEKADPRD